MKQRSAIMAVFKLPYRTLSFNDILIICPNCKAELIKKIELRATRYNQLKISKDKCPNCYNFI